jgi:hypothetical protein
MLCVPTDVRDVKTLDVYVSDKKLVGISCQDMDITVLSCEYGHLIKLYNETLWRFGRQLELGLAKIYIPDMSIIVNRMVGITISPLPVVDILIGKDLFTG